MSNLEVKQKKAIADYFQQEVLHQVGEMSGISLPDSEVKRLALNIVLAAETAIDSGKRPFVWNDKAARSFLLQAIKHVAMGLDAGAGEVYVYPYGKEMNVMPSYRGYRKIAKMFGVGPSKLLDIRPFAIYEGDSVHVEYGNKTDVLNVTPKSIFPSEKDKVVGYITAAYYEDGTCRVMTHTTQDVEKRRKANPMGDSPAWKNWPVEMAFAKIVKRHARTIDIALSQEARELFEIDEKDAKHVYEINAIPEPQIDKISVEALNDEPEESEEELPESYDGEQGDFFGDYQAMDFEED